MNRVHPQKDRRWRCILDTSPVGSRFATVAALLDFLRHFFGVDAGSLLPVEDGVLITLMEVGKSFCDVAGIDRVVPVDVAVVCGK